MSISVYMHCLGGYADLHIGCYQMREEQGIFSIIMTLLSLLPDMLVTYSLPTPHQAFDSIPNEAGIGQVGWF